MTSEISIGDMGREFQAQIESNLTRALSGNVPEELNGDSVLPTTSPFPPARLGLGLSECLGPWSEDPC